jgi:DNA-binding response OmpR family regulator
MLSTFQLGHSDKMRVLIADADRQSCSSRARSLDLLGYKVDQAASDHQARANLERERYDLMLLNLNATDDDGYELMSTIPETQPGLLLIVLTERPTVETAIKAIRAGAVDYLPEPVNIQNILRSVSRAIQKRAAERGRALNYISQLMDEQEKPESVPLSSPASQIGVDPGVKVAGNLRLDSTSHRLTIMGDPTYTVQLTRNVAAMLAGLMSYPNQVLSCRQIAKIAWGYDLPEDEAVGIVQSTIYRLRRRVGANPHSPEIIRTVRGRGYMFTPN